MAIKYAHIRRQIIKSPTETEERCLIDFNTHLQKLGTLTAMVFAHMFTSNELQIKYDKMMNDMEKKKDFTMLGPMH